MIILLHPINFALWQNKFVGYELNSR